MANHQPARLIVFIVACLVVAGCDDRPQPDAVIEVGPTFWVNLQNWRSEHAAQTMRSVAALQSATSDFLENPIEQSRVTWQKAWTKAHGDWLGFAYLEPGFETEHFRIDAWPITPGFIDSLPEYPHSGVVGEISLEITAETLSAQHGITDNSEVALGFHVLEYYAFERPEADFLEGAISLERRQQLIKLIPELLGIDLINFTSKTTSAGDFTLVGLIQTLRLGNQKTFSEFNLFGEHSRFSERSLRNTRAELTTLSEILGEPVGLNQLLAQCDPDLTATLTQTLAEAMGKVGNSEEINESDASRLLLLLSAISHQLEEFESRLAEDPG
jgi:hypothetical protein